MSFAVDRRVLSVLLALALAACAGGLGVSSAQAEGAPCPNEQLRAEQPFGLNLPDCRAYEMVSPLQKNDSDAVLPEYDGTRSSLSGEAVTYESTGVFAGAEGSQRTNQYVARRGPDGWSDQGITPPFLAYQASLEGAYPNMAFTPELTEGIAETDVPLEGEGLPEYYNLTVVDFASAPVSYRLVTLEPEDETTRSSEPEVAGVSTDLSHVVWDEKQHVRGWVDGTVSLVSVGEEGESLPAGAGGGAQPGDDVFTADTWRSVSADGSRVLFTDADNGKTPGKQLYMRENPTNPSEDCSTPGDACTVDVSASQRKTLDPLGPGSARFRGASVDGARVFFTDCSKLTEDATAVAPELGTACLPEVSSGSGPVPGNDLYEYDLETGVLSDLTVDGLTVAKTGDPLGAQVLGVPYISEDGSYVYFVAEGTLAGKNAEEKQPVSGEPNLYVAHYENGSWTTRFIATLAPSTSAPELEEGGDSDDWNEISPLDTVRATPDGTHLAFLSRRSLPTVSFPAGYDNEQAETGECENVLPNAGGESENGKCEEVFSYDAVSQRLACVSCDSSGARPIGPSSLGEYGNFSAVLQGYTPRNFSENGARLFFDSKDALVPHDSNGRQDVYEWEQDGVGGCRLQEGCIYPISDVAGAYESFFLDANPSGENVFFATEDQLVPADADLHVDVYDARVGGGFPVSVEPPVCDNGDSCKGPVSSQPGVFGAPASATFSCAGNVTPVAAVKPAVKAKGKAKPKCRKGFVKRKGKCVKRPKAGKKAKKSSGHSSKGGK
jgi:hypothetical protein